MGRSLGLCGVGINQNDQDEVQNSFEDPERKPFLQFAAQQEERQNGAGDCGLQRLSIGGRLFEYKVQQIRWRAQEVFMHLIFDVTVINELAKTKAANKC